MHPEDIHPNDFERVREEFSSQVYQGGSGFADDLTYHTKYVKEVPTEITGPHSTQTKMEPNRHG